MDLIVAGAEEPRFATRCERPEWNIFLVRIKNGAALDTFRYFSSEGQNATAKESCEIIALHQKSFTTKNIYTYYKAAGWL